MPGSLPRPVCHPARSGLPEPAPPCPCLHLAGQRPGLLRGDAPGRRHLPALKHVPSLKRGQRERFARWPDVFVGDAPSHFRVLLSPRAILCHSHHLSRSVVPSVRHAASARAAVPWSELPSMAAATAGVAEAAGVDVAARDRGMAATVRGRVAGRGSSTVVGTRRQENGYVLWSARRHAGCWRGTRPLPRSSRRRGDRLSRPEQEVCHRKQDREDGDCGGQFGEAHVRGPFILSDEPPRPVARPRSCHRGLLVAGHVRVRAGQRPIPSCRRMMTSSSQWRQARDARVRSSRKEPVRTGRARATPLRPSRRGSPPAARSPPRPTCRVRGSRG